MENGKMVKNMDPACGGDLKVFIYKNKKYKHFS